MSFGVVISSSEGIAYVERLAAHYREVRSRLNAAPPERELPFSDDEILGAMLLLAAAEAAALAARRQAARSAFAASFVRTWKGRAARLIALVAADFGVEGADISGRSWRAWAVRPRQVAMWIVKQASGWSLPRIGMAFGGRDHTTALHSVRRVEAMRAADPEFRARTDALRLEALRLK